MDSASHKQTDGKPQIEPSKELTPSAQKCRELLAESPFDGDLHQEIGQALTAGREFELAQQALESAQMLVPLAVESQIDLAHCYIENGKQELAIGLLEPIKEQQELSTAALLKAAEMLDRVNDYPGAWQLSRRAVVAAPEDAKAWFHLSFYMGRLKAPFSQVEAAARRAINLAPDNAEFRISLAAALCHFQRYSDAMQLVGQLINSDLTKVCCSSCLQNLRNVFETASCWDGVVACSEELTRRTVQSNPDWSEHK